MRKEKKKWGKGEMTLPQRNELKVSERNIGVGLEKEKE